MRVDPAEQFGLITFGLSVSVAAIIWGYGFGIIESWLFSITLVTFLTYGYDKAIAGSERTRVPEDVLLALTFAGGTLGALLGRPVFHHKTKKPDFRSKFWLVIGVQAFSIFAYFMWIQPLLASH